MKPLMLLSAAIVWFALCRLIPDGNTRVAVFFLVPFMLTIVAVKLAQSDGEVKP